MHKTIAHIPSGGGESGGLCNSYMPAKTLYRYIRLRYRSEDIRVLQSEGLQEGDLSSLPACRHVLKGLRLEAAV